MTNKERTPQVGDIWENENFFAFVVSTEKSEKNQYINTVLINKERKNIYCFVYDIERFLLKYGYKGESTLYGKNFFKRLLEVKCNHEIVEQESTPSEYEPSLVYFRGVCKRCGEVVFGTKEK